MKKIYIPGCILAQVAAWMLGFAITVVRTCAKLCASFRFYYIFLLLLPHT